MDDNTRKIEELQKQATRLETQMEYVVSGTREANKKLDEMIESNGSRDQRINANSSLIVALQEDVHEVKKIADDNRIWRNRTTAILAGIAGIAPFLWDVIRSRFGI